MGMVGGVLAAAAGAATTKPVVVAAKQPTGWDSVDWAQILLNWGVALIILVVGMWLARQLSQWLHRVLTRARVEITLTNFLRNVSYALLLVLVFVSALSKIGVPPTSLIAVLGAAGLAVGLALKDSLSNIAAGVMLIVLRPMRDGDHVVIAGQEGIVDEIRIFQTRIKAFDERMITLPNSTITTAPIINYSTLPTRRLEVTVGVGYGDDLKKAQQLLLQIAKDNPNVLDTPAPFVQVTNLGESTVDLMLFAYASNGNFGAAKSTTLEQIRDQLLENGLSIPYPQRDLHVYHHDADGKPIAELLRKGVTDDGDLTKGPPLAR
ncbi:mechanosensitive ion channel family protein [Xanthomonas campestris]|jgi:small-conductance mechanosensitive channel|uniref:mechanosensitive ion channel family protein n=1 Tax=Xanthomonas campestris TaxID=339 RepID=UPI00070B21B9|nr:mechanosensitive ion channel family protein [Xanthomonas campestris]MCC5050615.1 mechanosensitive ion channel family protein [Xanthomonas campestris pv. aberrans]MCC5066993.1 mechanosensitive ion channel family protein [Xanthomonas campestris]MCC5085648.1 mechanosensitive ion channel family protein [Xanthomonas campestris]MCF8867136.1 mechanosensitive ion channel family protein [Xanthomonas campestris pv. campestris]MDM7672973.1 mechanosensitive ion channel family protein [Xanthomonas campe